MKRPSPATVRTIRRAFTLVELLVVIGIIALLTGLMVPAFNSTLRANNLSTAGRILIDKFNLARQIAQTRNLPVEVRLYKLPDSAKAVTDSPAVYRAIQIFLIDERGTYVPVSKPDYFPGTVVLSSAVDESSLLSEPETTPSGATDPKAGTYGMNYRYVAFQFTPGGSTDLSAGKNFVTLVLQNDKTPADGGNFFTVQVDRINGSVRYMRP